jgi:hypothetical protein
MSDGTDLHDILENIVDNMDAVERQLDPLEHVNGWRRGDHLCRSLGGCTRIARKEVDLCPDCSRKVNR